MPVRMASERLPGKAAISLAGRPMILRLLDRIMACSYISKKRDIVICTTTNRSDDLLVRMAREEGFSAYRGDKNDIISRFYHAANEFNFDAIVQVDGDDPLSSFEYMDRLAHKWLQNTETDIVTVDGLPLGMATKVISRNAIKKVFQKYRSELNDTGFIYYFTKTNICQKKEIIHADLEHSDRKIRLTLDYDEDFQVFQTIFTTLQRYGSCIPIDNIIAFASERVDILSINSNLDDMYWARTIERANLKYERPDGQVDIVPVS